MSSTYHKSTLPNGLRLINVPMNGAQSITVLIMIGAGSRYETKRINGISHFLEHMAFKGTVKRPSALHISTLIDGIGGEFNAFTSKDHTGYYVKAHVKHTGLLFDVLSDMLLHSLLDKEEIEREKGVIIEEINLYEDTPMRKIGDLIENLLYGDHPLGWDVAGLEKNIRGITREDFVSYLNSLYTPNNCVVAVAGGTGAKTNQITSLTKQYLGDWASKPISLPQDYKDDQKKPALLLKFKDTNQAHLSIANRAYAIDDPRRFALSILSTVLGGGMSSRLFIEVRERRGLAYYVRSGAERYKEVGYFATTAGVDVKRIDEAIKVIIDQYAGLRNGTYAISKEEMSKAKEYIKGRMTLELEDSQAVAGLYASEEIIEGKILTPDEIIKKIDTVTHKEVMEVAKDIFTPNSLNLAVIGPFKDEAKFEKLLTL